MERRRKRRRGGDERRRRRRRLREGEKWRRSWREGEMRGGEKMEMRGGGEKWEGEEVRGEERRRLGGEAPSIRYTTPFLMCGGEADPDSIRR